MARVKLTENEIFIKVEKVLKNRVRLTRSDHAVLQLIQSKTVEHFTKEDLKKLRNRHHHILEQERLENWLEYLCSLGKNNRSHIENDIVEYSGYEDPFFQNEEKIKISLKMLKNYIRNVPAEIKLVAHNEIKKPLNNSYKQRDQKIKDRKKENHEKFFLGSVLISFLKSQDIEMNYLDITLKMIELYQTKNYFSREVFSEHEINEFKFSEIGRNFNDKKNSILSDPRKPFK